MGQAVSAQGNGEMMFRGGTFLKTDGWREEGTKPETSIC